MQCAPNNTPLSFIIQARCNLLRLWIEIDDGLKVVVNL